MFHGAYHGGVLNFTRGPSSVNVPHEFLIATYNDIDQTRHLIEAHVKDLAAILVEPMLGTGCIPADIECLLALRRAATDCGALLIFDEVITSRLAPGGRQQTINIIPDMFDMLTRGIYVARRGFIALSLPVGDAEVDRFVEAVRNFLETRRDLACGAVR